MWNSLNDPYETRSHDNALVDKITFKTRELHTKPISPRRNSSDLIRVDDDDEDNINNNRISIDKSTETEINDENIVEKNISKPISPIRYSPELGSRTPIKSIPQPSYKINLIPYKSLHGAMSPYTRDYYYISFQIEHPRILQGWRFTLTVTDSSDKKRIFELKNIDVDHENFLIFNPDSLIPPHTFSPVDMIPWIHEPRELMGHELNYTIFSSTPRFNLFLNKSIMYNDIMKTERYDGKNIIRMSPTPSRLQTPYHTKTISDDNTKQNNNTLTLPPVITVNKQILSTIYRDTIPVY